MKILKSRKNKIITSALLVALVATTLAFSQVGVNDPIVTLSYLNLKLGGIYSSLNTLSARDKFVPLDDIKAGTTIMLGESTEIIVRIGTAIVISPFEYGIPNVTTGKDIGNGMRADLNQLLICPRDDGRGVKFTTNGVIMIKGTYKIIN